MKLKLRRKILRYINKFLLQEFRYKLWAKLKNLKNSSCPHNGYFISTKRDRYGSNCIPWMNAIALSKASGKPLYHSCTEHCYRFKDTVMHKTLLRYSKPVKQCTKCDLNSREGWIYNQVNELIDLCDNQALPEALDITGTKDLLFSSYKEMAIENSWGIDFKPDNTIGIHVRLDDMTFKTTDNKQEFIGEDRLLQLINSLHSRYPTYHIRLITSPIKNDINLCKEVAKKSNATSIDVSASQDLDCDLYQMMMCDILILSRSTFSFVPALLHQGTKIFSYDNWKHLDEILGQFHENAPSIKSKIEIYGHIEN